ncbi:phage holin family protein [Patescibacteria group bacterium]|nr:phage holin family protein [Patescibacteria group bacterium]MCL5409789.1 phage holin family protein [Patescibacteria group bacterium]
MKILINWIVSALAVLATAYLLKTGVHVDNLLVALVVALVLGIINAILRPILLILTLPITLVTLGLFALVINALLVILTTAIVPGFQVDNFFWAIAFSVLLSIINFLLHKIFA